MFLVPVCVCLCEDKLEGFWPMPCEMAEAGRSGPTFWAELAELAPCISISMAVCCLISCRSSMSLSEPSSSWISISESSLPKQTRTAVRGKDWPRGKGSRPSAPSFWIPCSQLCGSACPARNNQFGKCPETAYMSTGSEDRTR